MNSNIMDTRPDPAHQPPQGQAEQQSQAGQQLQTDQQPQAAPPSSQNTVNTQSESVDALQSLHHATETFKKSESLPKPNKFSGDRKEYPLWRMHMQAKLRLDLSHKKDTDRVIYVTAFLEKDAGIFIQNFQNRIVEGNLNLKGLWEILNGRFLDPHRAQRAELDLSQLEQKSRPFVDFLTDFDRLWSEAQRDHWPDEVKMRELEVRLSGELRQIAMSAIPEKPVVYEVYCGRLHSLDVNYRSAVMDGAFKFSLGPSRAGRTTPSSKTLASAAASTPRNLSTPRNISTDPDAMDIDTPAARVNQMRTQRVADGSQKRPRLPQAAQSPSQRELSIRKERGCCLNCGNKGHFSRQCPWEFHGVRLNSISTSDLQPRMLERDSAEQDESENEQL